MRTPIVIGALLVTAGVSFLAGRLLAPVDTEEVHHIYVPLGPGAVDTQLEAFEQKFRDLMHRTNPRPAASPEPPTPAAQR
jgi:hypothetical protein